MAKAPKIAGLSHRVTLCSARDVVSEAGELRLTRVSAYDTWAAIRETRGSLFALDGVAIKEKRDTPSHEICIRYRRDKDISAAAWIYEQRLQSAPRWFKVISVSDVDEGGQFWKLRCRIVERSDEVSQPSPVAVAALPPGVTL